MSSLDKVFILFRAHDTYTVCTYPVLRKTNFLDAASIAAPIAIHSSDENKNLAHRLAALVLPSDPFTISDPKDQEIGEFYEARTDLEAQKL